MSTSRRVDVVDGEVGTDEILVADDADGFEDGSRFGSCLAPFFR